MEICLIHHPDTLNPKTSELTHFFAPFVERIGFTYKAICPQQVGFLNIFWRFRGSENDYGNFAKGFIGFNFNQCFKPTFTGHI